MSAMKMRLFVKDILFFGIILSSVGISSQQVIQTGLHDVSNTVGDDIAYFTVTIDSAVTDAGVWRKDGQVLLRIPGKLIFPKSPGFRQLVIYTVQFSDAGLYTFTIAGEISQARLTVTDTQLRVVTPLVETRYTIGGTINLVTRLSSTGISNGEWYKDNVLVISESRRVISVDGTDQKLTIHNARSSDTGLYQYRLDGLETAAYVSETTGQWSNWGQWTNISTCPATCGTSATNLRRRVRQCNNPAAHNGGQSCVGSGTQTESFQCGPDPCIVTVHGGWSEWDNWGSVFCPVTCGVSVQGPRVRHRTCTNPSPQNGGRNCPGSGSETEMSACTNISPCPSWSNWGSWGSPMCSVTCGSSVVGVRRRTRTCTNTQNGGCVGPSFEEENAPCGFQPCSYFEQTLSDTAARPGGFVVLSVTTTQSGLTGTWYKNNQMLSSSDRVQIRSSGAVHTLTISDVQVSDTGRYNLTVNGESTSAYLTVSDAIDGGVSEWSQWANHSCSATCGSGVRSVTRNRTCSNPVPSNGGNPCKDHLYETMVRQCERKACAGSTVERFIADQDRWLIAAIGAAIAIGVVLIIFIIACCIWQCRQKDPKPVQSPLGSTWEVDDRNGSEYVTRGKYNDPSLNGSVYK